MFWIHGGGYAFGSGNTFLYGPDFLVAQDVLVVTINYRLGPLGFLSAGRDAPGNAGLKVTVIQFVFLTRKCFISTIYSVNNIFLIMLDSMSSDFEIFVRRYFQFRYKMYW